MKNACLFYQFSVVKTAMSNQQENGNRDKPVFNIPSMEEVERKRESRSKQMPNFFKKSSSITTTTTTNDPLPNTQTVAPTIIPTTAPPVAPVAQYTPPTNSNTRSNIPTPIKRAGGGNTILVHPKQHKNPLLTHVRNVPWEPSEQIKVDYVVGQTTGVLYLSLRYHRLYPSYIYDRLTDCKSLYVTRILLVYVDVDSYHDALLEINRIAVLSDFTLILAWSMEEAGRYLETYKSFEHKGPDMIRGRVEEQYIEKATDALTQIKSVNKTDVFTLLSTFKSIKNISKATSDELSMCPGFGDQKVKRVQLAFKQPFLANKK